MCREIRCTKCSRPSWAGCGAHVEQVLGHVPRDKRCQCERQQGGVFSALKSLFKG
jgi:hypothetical protein